LNHRARVIAGDKLVTDRVGMSKSGILLASALDSGVRIAAAYLGFIGLQVIEARLHASSAAPAIPISLILRSVN
jgi:hypothetical protein